MKKRIVSLALLPIALALTACAAILPMGTATTDNMAKLRAGISRADDVRDLLGPPYRTDAFPRLEREVWSYKAYGGAPGRRDLFIQLSPDGLVREILLMDEVSSS